MKLSTVSGPLGHALALAMARADDKIKIVSARLATADDVITVATCNTAMTIKAEAPATVDQPGGIVVEAGRLSRLVSSFPAAAQITVTATANALTVSSGPSRYKLPAMINPPPLLVIDEETARIVIGGRDCLELFEPLPAASTESTRFYLNGLYLHSIDDRLFSVATDGHKLIRTSVAADAFPATILPAAAAAVLQRLVNRTRPDKVTLRRSRTLFGMTAPAFELTSTLIDARFPEYDRVIPGPSSNAVVCDRGKLLTALNRLEAVASGEDPKLLVMRWTSGGSLALSLDRQPCDASDAMAAELSGAAAVAVPIGQIAAMIDQFSGEKIRIESGTATQPVIFRSSGEKMALITACHFSNRPPEQR